jgi:hypothetical protein
MTSLSRFSAPCRCLAAAVLMLVAGGCDENGDQDAGVDAGGFDAGPRIDAPFFPDGTIFCETDEDCDDGVACTDDSCGMNGACRFRVDNAACDDGVFCNGVEQCDPVDGCVPGARQTCNDDDVCTVDRCDEAEKICRHFPRDLDEDGDPDWFCAGGGDCDDTDPLVSSMVSEVCGDELDNDCDEAIDEGGACSVDDDCPDGQTCADGVCSGATAGATGECGAPRFDVCDDPLDVSDGGFFELDTDGAAPDYGLSCRSGARDVVATFTLTEPRSVTIEAEMLDDLWFYPVAVSLRTACDDVDSELACESDTPGVVRRRSLEPGTYFVLLAASVTGRIGVDVQLGAPIDPPPNDTCATPLDVSAGGRFMGSFAEVANDLDTACSVGDAADLVYELTTTEERDVLISALSSSGANLSYSVRSSCADDATELRCAYGDPASGRLHQLAPGTYYVVVESSSSMDDFTLDVELLEPTPAPEGDACANAIALTSGTPAVGTLADKQNDERLSCGFRSEDAVYSFTLAEASDVTLELDAGGFAYLELRSTCDEASSASRLQCTTGNPSFQRHYDLAPGTYYAIVESLSGSGFTLGYEATTPPTTPVAVSGNDNCASAHPIDLTANPGGAVFTGSTTDLLPDIGGTFCGAGAESNDAVFELVLDRSQRVVLSTEGSTFDTVLHVHEATCADGGDRYCNDEAPGASQHSLIDRTLSAGTWYVVVDGWGSSSAGDYVLQVAITDP